MTDTTDTSLYADSVVRTVGLTKAFRDFWLREKVTAVDNLDLNIAPQQVFGLLGPNGSGKSTTLKMILGLLFPTRGVVSVFGCPPSNVAVKSRIGFLPEESHLYPFLDARETLDFYARLFKQPRKQRQRRIDMLLEMVGLQRVAYRRVGEYSKGMQRRIGLAQALINDPDLLILDEPTSGLDPMGTKQFKGLIRTLADRGKTVILSSHLLADVEDVCDRVAVLYGGQLRAQGNLDELLAKKEFTQITTECLDDVTLAKIETVVEKAGREVVSVSAPQDRLESLFLRIVEEAREQKVVTGGAVATGQVAAFLRGGDQEQGQAVIDTLISKMADSPELPVEDEAAAEPGLATEEVLQELVTPSAAPPETQVPTSPPPATGASVDRSLIEGLLGDADTLDASDESEPRGRP